MISKLQKLEAMQPQQNQKEAMNGSRFDQIDKRWTVVQDAFRIEDVQRSQDLYILKEQLQERKTKAMSIQQRKAEILGNTLRKISSNACESKQNLGKLFETEASFRIQHLDNKNDFIQTYLHNGSRFNSTLQQYANNKIKDVCSKLESIDAANVAKTQQTVKNIKQEVIGQARANFDKEKEKYSLILAKMSNDAHKSMEQLRDLLQVTRKQREQKEVKLRLMISGLLGQLTQLSDTEAKQGEMTYDCLLKLLEECCGKIQQAQLK